MNTKIIILALVVFFIRLACKISERSFDDNDPDLDWYDNYTVIECPHLGEKTLKTEWTACGCEKTNLYCDDCGAVVKEGKPDC